VVAEGIDLTALVRPIEEIFFRCLSYREFDVNELSLAKYVSLVSQGKTSLVAIPVFPAQAVRAFYAWSLIFRREAVNVQRTRRGW
jgi:hypothetical protein